MIIIIRALSRKKERDAKESQIKKEAKEAHEKKRKNERKRENGQCYYPFTTLVLQSSTMFFIYRVSYVVAFIY